MTPAGSFSLPASHPMFVGHFPGNPIVPGAYLLALLEQHANDWLRAQGHGTHVVGVSAVKFTRPVRPEEACSIFFGEPAAAALRFRLQVDTVPCAAGTFALQARAAADA